MIDITFKNIEKYYGVTQILKDVSFDLHKGDKIGLIGRNGCGKTTLFKIAAGLEEYQGGQLFTRKLLKIAYLDQMPSYKEDWSVIEILRLPFQVIYDLQKKMRNLEMNMSSARPAELEKVMKEYSFTQERYESMDGYSVEEQVSKITTGLGFKEDFLNKKYSHLSGGQKTIVEFAKILLGNPDVLLLDEPTNHLDFKAIEWLENYLKDFEGAVIVVSHDRYFLDQVVTRIVEIESGVSELYHGNYTYYVVEKERRYEEMLKQYNNQQKKLKSMQQAVYRFREWGRVSDNQAFFKKAQNMERRMEKMDKVDQPRINRRNLMLDLKDQNRSGKEVLLIENMSKSFEGHTLFKNVDIEVYYQDAFAIVGGNGVGKSTILKSVLNIAFENSYPEYVQDEGKIRIAKNAKIAFLEQEVTFEEEELTVLQSITNNRVMTEGEARYILAAYLFVQEDVFKQIKDLSGGERSRLRLCHLLLDEVNFMILDEPTNHLDIQSREMLEEALIKFSGTLLFISHDRYFINRLAQEVYELHHDGFEKFIGNYDDYSQQKLKRGIDTKTNQTLPQPKVEKKSKPQGPKKVNLYKKNQLEEDIKNLEVKIQQISELIELTTSDYDELTVLMKTKGNMEQSYEELMEKWIDIMD